MTETTVNTCPRHPRVETELRCATCGQLICPQCMVQTPVGAKCRDCGTAKGGKLFTLTPLQLASAVGVGLIAGAAAGWAVEFYIGIYFTLILSFAFGGFLGEVIMRASGRKRGLKMEMIAGTAMVLGAILGRLVVGALLMASPGQAHPPMGVLQVLYDLVSPNPIPLVALIIIIGSAVSRIRYL